MELRYPHIVKLDFIDTYFTNLSPINPAKIYIFSKCEELFVPANQKNVILI